MTGARIPISHRLARESFPPEQPSVTVNAILQVRSKGFSHNPVCSSLLALPSSNLHRLRFPLEDLLPKPLADLPDRSGKPVAGGHDMINGGRDVLHVCVVQDEGG